MSHILRAAACVCECVCTGVLVYRSLFASVVCVKNRRRHRAAQANESGQAAGVPTVRSNTPPAGLVKTYCATIVLLNTRSFSNSDHLLVLFLLKSNQNNYILTREVPNKNVYWF